MAKKIFPTLGAGVVPRADKTTRQNMDNVFNALLNLVAQHNYPSGSRFSSVITITYNRIQVMYSEDGMECLKAIKLYRKWFVELLRGLRLPNPGVRAWHWDAANKCPTMLTDLVQFVKENVFSTNEEKLFFWRISIALLSLDRVMIIPAEPNYKTIEDPGIEIDVTSELYPKVLRPYYSHLGFSVEDFRKEYKSQCENFEYEVLSSAGVNGQATWTAHSDARAMFAFPKTLSAFKIFADESNLSHIFNDMANCVHIKGVDDKPFSDLQIGRLHSFDEWGGKVRTVAILDYWTQMLLTPLHKTINHFLKKCEMDGTFDQTRIAEKVRSWTSSGTNEIFSFDLTAATDRLPISLQVDIISDLLGNSKLAQAWKEVLVRRTYAISDKQCVGYKVGQPMGARSSFAMLALTHHIIVQHAIALAKSTDTKGYVVLGDDMTVLGNGVAGKYRNIMGLLGVPINLSKSVIHHKDCLPAAEICKRVFISGDEVTTIPVKLLTKTIRDGVLAPVLQGEFQGKGWEFTSESFSGFFYGILNEQSFKDLVVLNCLPASCSGLKSRVILYDTPFHDYTKWFDGFDKLNEKVIDNVFTWTAAVEALKRLDGLLRNTLAISTAISEKFSLYTNSPVNVKTLWEILGIPTDTPSDVVSSLLKDIKHLEPSHPIIRATEAEIKRITEIMAGLISHDTNVYNKAKNGLMDMVRNALTDVWTDTEAAKAAGVRTLVTKGITNINKMILKGYKIKGQDGITMNITGNMTLDYNLTLNTLGRQWNVKVGFDYGVNVNSVKSNVLITSAGHTESIKSAIKSVSITSFGSKTNSSS